MTALKGNSLTRSPPTSPPNAGSLSVEQARTIFPSFTFPAWASCFTGNFPHRTGIVGNGACFTGSQSTHGSLFPEDSLIPFYVWGEPLNVQRGEKGSVRIKAADIVDLTATVLSYLRIYQPHSGQIDGKPLFDEDLNINLEDFEIVEENHLDALEILFGRRV